MAKAINGLLNYINFFFDVAELERGVLYYH